MRILIAALLFVSLVVQAQDGPPKSKTEVEQIVREYLMKHPEVIIEAVSKYQENQRTDEKKRTEQMIISKHGQLMQDPASPAAGAEASKDIVTVVEFFDYRCGYCKRMAPSIAKLVTGAKIRLVYKELPILGPDSTVASKAALAARKQGDYLKFHQDLMALQGTITLAVVEDLAAKHKLDAGRLKADMEAPDVQTQLAANQSLAAAIGVNATPSFVIGSELFTGAMDEQDFQAAISKAQKR